MAAALAARANQAVAAARNSKNSAMVEFSQRECAVVGSSCDDGWQRSAGACRGASDIGCGLVLGSRIGARSSTLLCKSAGEGVKITASAAIENYFVAPAVLVCLLVPGSRNAWGVGFHEPLSVGISFMASFARLRCRCSRRPRRWARCGIGIMKNATVDPPVVICLSRIKPCMFGPWDGAIGPYLGVHCCHVRLRRSLTALIGQVRASVFVTLKKLECSKQAYALDTLAWDNIIGFGLIHLAGIGVMITRGGRGIRYFIVGVFGLGEYGARLKLKGIGGRAPRGVELRLDSTGKLTVRT
ncbi:hypothetical protein FNV43_RR20980 [Rhamnella rubrinervis]|uniref:Uncharacterized protein n=1 Tax=Rhamnella rubrinervis TaxID=2594499 RepID=A0A8K0GTX8_9ROSA|nr:hypothetical protein FNV43_RR20980 [Rhamnella rubrinervis]